MTDREIMQQALDAMRSLMNGRDFGTGQTGHYLNIISRIENELSRPKPEFYPDWDMLKPYHDRIKELEDRLAQPEQDHGFDRTASHMAGEYVDTAQPEQFAVAFPSFMRKRIEQAMEDAPKGMSVHDGKVKVLVSDLHRMLLVIDSVPPKPWVGLTDADLMKEFGYTDELLRDTAYRVQQKLKELNK